MGDHEGGDGGESQLAGLAFTLHRRAYSVGKGKTGFFGEMRALFVSFLYLVCFCWHGL